MRLLAAALTPGPGRPEWEDRWEVHPGMEESAPFPTFALPMPPLPAHRLGGWRFGAHRAPLTLGRRHPDLRTPADLCLQDPGLGSPGPTPRSPALPRPCHSLLRGSPAVSASLSHHSGTQIWMALGQPPSSSAVSTFSLQKPPNMRLKGSSNPDHHHVPSVKSPVAPHCHQT